MHLDKTATHQQQDLPRSFDFGDRKTFKIEPPTDCTFPLLTRLSSSTELAIISVVASSGLPT